MCLFIQSQEEKDVATVELKKIIYITFKGVGDGGGGGGNSERKYILVLKAAHSKFISNTKIKPPVCPGWAIRGLKWRCCGARNQ